MLPTKVVEKTKTHILCSITFFSENRAAYEKMWRNLVQPYMPQMTIWRMRTECWITKATNAHSQYVILIALLMQQWLRERLSMLRYTYITCHVSTLCVTCFSLKKCS